MGDPMGGEAEPLNPREQLGRRMRLASASILGLPLALVLLPFYLRKAMAGHRDRWAPYTFAAVTVAMLSMPLWILGMVYLLR